MPNKRFFAWWYNEKSYFLSPLVSNWRLIAFRPDVGILIWLYNHLEFWIMRHKALIFQHIFPCSVLVWVFFTYEIQPCHIMKPGLRTTQFWPVWKWGFKGPRPNVGYVYGKRHFYWSLSDPAGQLRGKIDLKLSQNRKNFPCFVIVIRLNLSICFLHDVGSFLGNGLVALSRSFESKLTDPITCFINMFNYWLTAKALRCLNENTWFGSSLKLWFGSKAKLDIWCIAWFWFLIFDLLD